MKKDLTQTSASGLPKATWLFKPGLVGFPSVNPNIICDNLKLVGQAVKSGFVSNRFGDEIVAKIDNILKNQGITSTQQIFFSIYI